MVKISTSTYLNHLHNILFGIKRMNLFLSLQYSRCVDIYMTVLNTFLRFHDDVNTYYGEKT